MLPATPRLDPVQGRILVELARRALKEKFEGKAGAVSDDAVSVCDPCLQACSGIFVTLKIGRCLRGCIGSLVGREPLIEGVRTYALLAAFDDPRFRPLNVNELDKVSIEISVLTPAESLSYKGADDLLSKLRPHVDGVTIRQGCCSATFLPQVWEQLPEPEEFLSNLCLKAGLPSNVWRNGSLEIETYQVQYFKE